MTKNPGEKRKETSSKLRKFRRTHNPQHRQVYTESRREYIALLKQKKREYKQNKYKILAEEINNPQTFWKELRKCAGSRASHRISKRISTNEWFDHFSKLVDLDDRETEHVDREVINQC